MFRHKNKPVKKTDNQEDENKKADEIKVNKPNQEADLDKKQTKEESVRELLEKNLKWSQIIYEQNRKINRKLMWASIAGWMRLILILAPLILAILYLPPFIKDAWSKFGTLTSVMGTGGGTNAQGGSLDNLIKVFELSPSQKEQIKAILK